MPLNEDEELIQQALGQNTPPKYRAKFLAHWAHAQHSTRPWCEWLNVMHGSGLEFGDDAVQDFTTGHTPTYKSVPACALHCTSQGTSCCNTRCMRQTD